MLPSVFDQPEEPKKKGYTYTPSAAALAAAQDAYTLPVQPAQTTGVVEYKPPTVNIDDFAESESEEEVVVKQPKKEKSEEDKSKSKRKRGNNKKPSAAQQAADDWKVKMPEHTSPLNKESYSHEPVEESIDVSDFKRQLQQLSLEVEEKSAREHSAAVSSPLQKPRMSNVSSIPEPMASNASEDEGFESVPKKKNKRNKKKKKAVEDEQPAIKVSSESLEVLSSTTANATESSVSREPSDAKLSASKQASNTSSQTPTKARNDISSLIPGRMETSPTSAVLEKGKSQTSSMTTDSRGSYVIIEKMDAHEAPVVTAEEKIEENETAEEPGEKKKKKRNKKKKQRDNHRDR